MDVGGPEKGAEVAGIVRYEDHVAVEAAGQHAVVGFAEAAEVPRVRDDVQTFGGQRRRDARRHALVEEKAHGKRVELVGLSVPDFDDG